MKFALLVYEEKSEFEARTSPEAQEYWGAYKLYSNALVEAGVLSGGNALQEPSLATTVRLSGNETTVVDGPFAETKEQFGGMFVLEVPDLDTALQWAQKCPAVTRGSGSVEVRPVLEMDN